MKEKMAAGDTTVFWVYPNSAILSRVLTRYEASSNAKALALITQI
jgi:hypothetical protein